jgi:hypothetical protein
MEWNRSNTIGLASESCCYCKGDGMRAVYEDKKAPCNCVFRAAFRACYARFRECAVSGEQPGNVAWEIIGGPGGRRMYSRRHEEYMADFTLIARRELNDYDYRIFRIHYLLGADGKLTAQYFKMDRGTFWHAIYRIEQRLGRAYCEIKPYPLFPLDEYFGWTLRKDAVRALYPIEERKNRLKVPYRLSA